MTSHRPGRWRRIVLVIVLLAAPALFVKLVLLHPRPGDVLRAMMETYRGLPYYSDETTVDIATFGSKGSYRLWFARPNKLRVEFHGLAEFVMVCDGEMLYTYLPDRHEYVAEPAPERLPYEFPTGQPSLTLSLLNGRSILPERARLGYVGRRTCGGVSSAHTFSVEAPPSEAPGISRMQLTVGADGLIHCAAVLVRVGQGAANYELIHSSISTAPPPEDTFRFEPPPGARRIEPAEATPTSPPNEER